jgi:hypothetical protein
VRQAVQKGLTQVGQKSSNILKNAPLMPKTASARIQTEQSKLVEQKFAAEQSKNLQVYSIRRDATDGIDRAAKQTTEQVRSANRIPDAKSEVFYDNSLGNRLKLHKALKQSGVTPVASTDVNPGMAKLTQTEKNIAIAKINNQVALGQVAAAGAATVLAAGGSSVVDN